MRDNPRCKVRMQIGPDAGLRRQVPERLSTAVLHRLAAGTALSSQVRPERGNRLQMPLVVAGEAQDEVPRAGPQIAAEIRGDA